jgi:hypothetical protein
MGRNAGFIKPWRPPPFLLVFQALPHPACNAGKNAMPASAWRNKHLTELWLISLLHCKNTVF